MIADRNNKGDIDAKRIENELNDLLLQQPVDLIKLRSYSRQSGGFQNQQLRKRIWPKLLGINRFALIDYRNFLICPHRDENQIRADVERSLWHFEESKFWKETYRERRRQVLTEIIMAILVKHRHLHYYQGFHDLISIIMQVVEDDFLTFGIGEYLALHYVSDYMKENFDIVSKFMYILFVIIRSVDLELYQHLEAARMEPFFAISWLITWFSHDIKHVEDTARIYDVLLSSPPIFCFYLCAVYVIHIREFILKVEPDFAMIHDVLMKAPHKYGFPFELVLKQADDLFQRLPLSAVLPLCDPKLFKIITCNSIVLFEKPKFQLVSVDSDWKLLEQLKLQKWNNFYYWQYYFQSLWGWTISFLPNTNIDRFDHYEFNNQPISETLDKGKLKSKHKKKRSYSIQKDVNLSAEIVKKDSRVSKIYLSNHQIFWCLTVFISGVLGYYVIFQKPQ